MKSKLIVASTRNSDLAFCEAISKHCSIEIHILKDAEDFASTLKEYPESFLFWDLDNMEFNVKSYAHSFFQLDPIIKKSLHPSHVFGLANQTRFDLPPVSQLKTVGHYLTRNFDTFAVDWISKIIHLLHLDLPLDASKLSENQEKVQIINLTHTKEKNAAIEAVGNLLRRRQLPERTCQLMIRNLDELLLNALFNAPRDSKGKFYRRELDRGSQFRLKDSEKISLSLVFNTEEIILCVYDPFGSFTSELAWKAFRESYRHKRYVPDQDTKNAGLGLQGVSRSGVGLLISSLPKKGTHAMIAIPYFKRFKQSKNCFNASSFISP